MNTSEGEGAFRPFEELGAMLKSSKTSALKQVDPPAPDAGLVRSSDYDSSVKQASFKEHRATGAASPGIESSKEPEVFIKESDIKSDDELFKRAMEGVIPAAWKKISAVMTAFHNKDERGRGGADEVENSDDQECIEEILSALVRGGKGFVVADTPEYIEGLGYESNPEAAKRLHRGDFAIQAQIDLHGMYAHEAKDAFESFLGQSIGLGRRAVKIVHGRGLSSPKKPVIKPGILQLLNLGRWKKWVIAYSSAPWNDGGTGATYILLRKRPMTKGQRKKKQRKLAQRLSSANEPDNKAD